MDLSHPKSSASYFPSPLLSSSLLSPFPFTLLSSFTLLFCPIMRMRHHERGGRRESLSLSPALSPALSCCLILVLARLARSPTSLAHPLIPPVYFMLFFTVAPSSRLPPSSPPLPRSWGLWVERGLAGLAAVVRGGEAGCEWRSVSSDFRGLTVGKKGCL